MRSVAYPIPSRPPPIPCNLFPFQFRATSMPCQPTATCPPSPSSVGGPPAAKLRLHVCPLQIGLLIVGNWLGDWGVHWRRTTSKCHGICQAGHIQLVRSRILDTIWLPTVSRRGKRSERVMLTPFGSSGVMDVQSHSNSKVENGGPPSPSLSSNYRH